MSVTEETKKYVTPYAFRVADDLLGKRLASPSKRLSAIIIDMILVGLLTTLNSLVLTGLIGVTALFGFNNVRKNPDKKTAAGFLLATSIVCTTIVLIGLTFDGAEVDVGDASASAATEDVATSTEPQKNDESTSVVQWLRGAIADLGISFGWAALYFTAFIAWLNGQTPGKLALGIRVIRIDGREMSLWDSFGRYGGYGAGLATGLLGFFQIYWDANRQAIQDKISETIVIDLRKPDAVTMPDY